MSVSAPTINVTALLAPGAAGPASAAGKAAGGALAGFEAMMGAFFASTDTVLQAATTPAIPAGGAPGKGLPTSAAAANSDPAAAALGVEAAQAGGAPLAVATAAASLVEAALPTTAGPTKPALQPGKAPAL